VEERLSRQRKKAPRQSQEKRRSEQQAALRIKFEEKN
jgi:hypothetical protein